MKQQRETATADERETREGAGGGIPLNRKDRRAAAKVGRQIADIDRQIAEREAKGEK